MKKLIMAALILCQLILTLPQMVYADYRYNGFDETIPAQSSFTAVANYNGKQYDIGTFKNPQDIYVEETAGLIYLLDSGNSRIVVFNEDLELVRVISEVKNGENVEAFEAATGIFVKDGIIYVADAAKKRVLGMDEEGNVLRVVTRPDSNLLTDDIAFLPRNVIVDDMGTMYIISEDSTQGAFMIDQNGNFLGFYGRNEVNLTAEILVQSLKRRFMTEEQRAKSSNFIPVEFANFDIDSEGFIYTVTAYAEEPKKFDMIRKLNPLGDNILTGMYRIWGDEKRSAQDTTTYKDIAVDSDGFMYALDETACRIFQYDNTGYQISIFGGAGSQLGYFTGPTAIECLGTKILVLDSKKNNITVFEQTAFGECLKNGMVKYNEGMPEEALDYFKELIKMDANFEFAYYAIASAYYEAGEYEEALAYAELAGTSTEMYSKAKKEIRNEWMRENFSLVFFGVIFIFLVIVIVGKVTNAKLEERKRNAVPKEDRG